MPRTIYPCINHLADARKFQYWQFRGTFIGSRSFELSVSTNNGQRKSNTSDRGPYCWWNASVANLNVVNTAIFLIDIPVNDSIVKKCFISLQLERKPQFYVLSLMFPSILISSIALLGFILPPESGEKVSLEITVLLSIAVFMLMVSDIMPPNSETFPYIGKFLTDIIPIRIYNANFILLKLRHFKIQYFTIKNL